MKKKVFLFLIVFLLGFSLAWAGDNPKDKKVYFRFSVGYGLPLGTNSLRPSWDLGYLTFYFGQEGFDSPPTIMDESWLLERTWQEHYQQAPAPQDYFWFDLINEVPEFYLKPGDRVILEGYSKSQYKNVVPQINVGADFKIAKKVFLALDLFARQDQWKIQEDAHVFYVKQVWGPYYYLPDPRDGHYQSTEWYLDSIVEHPGVVMEMNLWNFGITPALKFEISIFKNLSIFPRVGIALFMSKTTTQSDWTLNYLYPYQHAMRLEEKPAYFGDTNWQLKESKTEFAVAPVIGFDFGIGKNFYLSTELQLGTGKNFPVLSDEGEGIYKGLLLYNTDLNAQKVRFIQIDPAGESYRHGNYGTPSFDDFVHLNKVKLLKVSAGFRF